MQLSTILTLALGTLVAASPLSSSSSSSPSIEEHNTITKRACHGSGEIWGDQRTPAIDAVKRLCDGVLAQKSYDSGVQLNSCVNLGTRLKGNFYIKNISVYAKWMSYEECYSGLSKEVYGCDRGGVTSYANWKYSADPNAGQC